MTLREKSDAAAGYGVSAVVLAARHGLRTIEFPDLTVSDYNAPLLSADFDPGDDELRDLWADIRRRCRAPTWCVSKRFPTALFGRDEPAGAARMDGPSEVSAWTVELPATKSEYDERLLNKKTRKRTGASART